MLNFCFSSSFLSSDAAKIYSRYCSPALFLIQNLPQLLQFLNEEPDATALGFGFLSSELGIDWSEGWEKQAECFVEDIFTFCSFGAAG